MKQSLQKILVMGLVCFASAVTAAPCCMTSPNWTGVYFGPQVGYTWGSATWVFPFNEFYNTAVGQSFSLNPTGATAGAHLGFNYQINSIVAGLEASVNGGSITQKRTGPVVPIFPNDVFETQIDSVATLTARLGYALNKWLLYARGGYATARIALSAVSGNPGAGVIANASATQNGWTAGAGLEYMCAPTIIFGLQYDYTKLNNKQYSTTTTGTLVGLPFHINLQHVNVDTVTARLSIKFL